VSLSNTKGGFDDEEKYIHGLEHLGSRKNEYDEK